MQIVAGLFTHFSDAEKAVRDLLNSEFPKENVSLIGPHADDQHARKLGVDEWSGSETKTTEDVGIGAAVGGLSGWLVGLGAIAIPGIGPVIAAGPIASAFTGAGVGATAGGFIALLTKAGIPKVEARAYDAGLRNGGTLVMVDSDEQRVSLAEKILKKYHVIDLQAHSEKKAKEESKAHHERNEKHIHEKKNFESMEPDFYKHFENHYAKSGMTYGAYRSAYEFGFNRAGEDHFREEDWSQAEADIRQEWQHHHHTLDWSEYRDAIQEGWSRAKQEG